MTERPILFSAPMVLGLLAGTKTQTRRTLKVQTDGRPLGWGTLEDGTGVRTLQCPYGRVGDRLWVREAWGYRGSAWNNGKPDVRDVSIEYRADAKILTFTRRVDDEAGIPQQRLPEKFDGVRRASECQTEAQFDLSCEYDDWLTRWWRSWRPSIFLPRWASRLSLEITGVRVERLQAISAKDAIDEGLTAAPSLDGPTTFGINGGGCWHSDPRESYRELWKSINGADSWAANPWVWVVEFRGLP